MRPTDFDPYNEWLDIPPHDQPPDHYQLLDIAKFETDPVAIQKATDGRMAHVRRFQTGPRGHYTQELLNRLAAAKLTLLDESARAAYDRTLRDRLPSGAPEDGSTGRPTTRNASMSVFAKASTVGLGSARTRTTSGATVPVAQPFSPTEPRDDQGKVSETPLYRHTWLLIATVAVLLVVCALALGLRTLQFDVDHPIPPRTAGQPEVDLRQSPPGEGEEGHRPSDPGGIGTLVNQEADCSVNLTAPTALLRGELQLVKRGDHGVIANWVSTECSASWRFRVFEEHKYLAEITYAATADAQGHRYTVEVGGVLQERSVSLRDGPGILITDQLYVVLPRTGEHRLVVHTTAPTRQGLMELKSIRLMPIRRGKATSIKP